MNELSADVCYLSIKEYILNALLMHEAAENIHNTSKNDWKCIEYYMNNVISTHDIQGEEIKIMYLNK